MFVDKIKIYARAGNGGDGCVSFHTEKYISNGGPNGGDGGKGGDIVFRGDISKNNLVDFFYQTRFKAEDGARGEPNNRSGKGGKDLVISVPLGTLIRDAKSGRVLADICENGDTYIALRGGNGGRGNTRFATSRRQAPHFSQKGQKSEQYELELELMTIADVGLIGFPNAGKSTLLSVITAARPKIANYHFTTLMPNLGVVQRFDQNILVADIPGLIEGAADGAGLGHDFLRHIRRTRLLLHLVDISSSDGRDPLMDYKTINNELKRFDKTLARAPQIVVLTKTDLLYDDLDKIKEFKARVRKPVFCISSITHKGLDELLNAVVDKLKDLPKAKSLEVERVSADEFKCNEIKVEKVEEGFFYVGGGAIENVARGVVLDDPDSNRFFQKFLIDKGVIDRLIKLGLKQGDTVKVLDIEFEWVF